jgi:hypothetical protein
MLRLAYKNAIMPTPDAVRAEIMMSAHGNVSSSDVNAAGGNGSESDSEHIFFGAVRADIAVRATVTAIAVAVGVTARATRAARMLVTTAATVMWRRKNTTSGVTWREVRSTCPDLRRRLKAAGLPPPRRPARTRFLSAH